MSLVSYVKVIRWIPIRIRWEDSGCGQCCVLKSRVVVRQSSRVNLAKLSGLGMKIVWLLSKLSHHPNCPTPGSPPHVSFRCVPSIQAPTCSIFYFIFGLGSTPAPRHYLGRFYLPSRNLDPNRLNLKLRRVTCFETVQQTRSELSPRQHHGTNISDLGGRTYKKRLIKVIMATATQLWNLLVVVEETLSSRLQDLQRVSSAVTLAIPDDPSRTSS